MADGFGRTIQLFLVDGKPSGLRKATIHGWTGLVFVAGDSAFGDMTARKEIDRTGVYILTGPDSDQLGATRVYIGSGNSVSERIKQSAIKRIFGRLRSPLPLVMTICLKDTQNTLKLA